MIVVLFKILSNMAAAARFLIFASLCFRRSYTFIWQLLNRDLLLEQLSLGWTAEGLGLLYNVCLAMKKIFLGNLLIDSRKVGALLLLLLFL